MVRASVLFLISTLWLASSGSAQEAFWPGVSYDPSVPTMEQVLGHAPGDRIVSHAEMIEYLGALSEARPAQIKVHEYARTWEGRELVYADIGSAANIGRLDEIRANIQKLADPRKTTDAEAAAIIENQPAITWLAYGVHGNEISSPDASLLTAYHLLAAQGDEIVDTISSETLVIIVPTQNADGRDRFVNHFRVAEGIAPSAHPASAEHDEPWPGGRTNHYYFDLNRDWLAITQPETRGHVRALLEWFPQIFIDLHEMGGNSTCYFTPEAVPYNPPHHFGTERNARCLRAQQREVVRCVRIPLFHARDLRRFLPGLRRELAALSRDARGDLRTSVGPRARLPAQRRDGPSFQRRRASSLRGLDRHRRNDRPQPRALSQRLLDLSPIRHRGRSKRKCCGLRR